MAACIAVGRRKGFAAPGSLPRRDGVLHKMLLEELPKERATCRGKQVADKAWRWVSRQNFDKRSQPGRSLRGLPGGRGKLPADRSDRLPSSWSGLTGSGLA